MSQLVKMVEGGYQRAEFWFESVPPDKAEFKPHAPDCIHVIDGQDIMPLGTLRLEAVVPYNSEMPWGLKLNSLVQYANNFAEDRGLPFHSIEYFAYTVSKNSLTGKDVEMLMGTINLYSEVPKGE